MAQADPKLKAQQRTTQPPLPFSRSEQRQGSPGSTSRPDRNKQSKQRVSCPSREGLKRAMAFIKMQGRDTSSQSKASLELARSNRRRATRVHANTDPVHITQPHTGHSHVPSYQVPKQGSQGAPQKSRPVSSWLQQDTALRLDRVQLQYQALSCSNVSTSGI